MGRKESMSDGLRNVAQPPMLECAADERLAPFDSVAKIESLFCPFDKVVHQPILRVVCVLSIWVRTGGYT